MSNHLPCHGEHCFCLDTALQPEGQVFYGCDPIAYLFGLSYASYLVLPRAVLQSMPADWQARFVLMVGEIEDRLGDYPEAGTYDVRLKDEKGRFVSDPLSQYRHTRLAPKNPAPTIKADDEGPCPDGEHKWVGRQMGGSPDMAESCEWVEYCDVCGMERQDD